MEDISRELEREIAQSKPKPYKQDRRTRVLIVDDFGQMKSGEYLKKLALILSGVSLVFFITIIVLYQLYSGLAYDTKQTTAKLAVATDKVDALIHEKEVLMARLVMSGKELGIELKEPMDENEATTEIQTKVGVAKNKLQTNRIPPEPDKTQDPAKLEKPDINQEQQETKIKPQINPIELASEESESQLALDDFKRNVSIEKFTVTKDGTNGDLLVRFDIRNTSTESGDVSGRIFTVLKPDNNYESQWLVVPATKLENGVPSEIRKGQYFSIAHFKPVKFRIQNHSNPDFFKKASIYIFNNQGELIFEKLIDITEED
ncbi:MAG: hypothetical protein ABIJ59_06050 [Pseudomonadota bacterium]